MPILVTPPSPPEKNISLQKIAEVPRATPVPSLAPGERLNVLVLGDSRNGQTLIQAKNTTLLAQSPLPLRAGETLTVQVDQTHPVIVLRAIPADSEMTRTAEFLKLYRSNPGAFREILTSLQGMFSGGATDPISRLLSKREAQNLHRILGQIILSDENLSNPLFLKDFVSSLGLAGERRLMKALSDPAALGARGGGASLKEILLKLSADGPQVPTDRGIYESEGGSVRGVRDLAERAATVIESLQIVNVLAQEQDGLFVLQVPAQCPDGIRMQEIFIETDRGTGEQAADRGARVALFLDLDSLGELSVALDLKAGTLLCTIRAADPEVVDFLQPLLPSLRHTLTETGYAIGALQCVLDRDIGAGKLDLLQGYRVFSQNSIDVTL